MFVSILSLQNSTARTTNWWCSVRGKQNRCSAAVRQRNGDYFRNEEPHNHPADLACPLRVVATAKVRKKICFGHKQSVIGLTHKSRYIAE